jgi:hypothetical protein
MWYSPGMNAGKVSIEEVAYGGWAHNLRLSNADVELVVTLDVGPRVIRYATLGGKNLLHEDPGQLGKSGEPGWMARGGHRLWTAPEDEFRTYAPDNRPVKYALAPGGAPDRVRITQAPDEPYGVQKELEIALAPTGSEVSLLHRITNVGAAPIDVSAWALTVMPPGGTAIIPLPPKRPHPGSLPTRVASDYWANQTLALWSYLDLKDPRLTLGTSYITVRQDPASTTQLKLGLSHEAGWLGYARAGDLFVKWVDYRPGKLYPDRGCNFETYTDPNILEIETLGPQVTLAPGEKTEHAETWHVVTDIGPITDEASITKAILPRLKKR